MTPIFEPPFRPEGPKVSDGRIIGIDYGLKRIGLSLSDGAWLLASPWKRINRPHSLVDTIQLLVEEIKIIEAEKKAVICQVVMGYPRKMNGSTGVMADEVLQAATLLTQALQLPVVLWDERLTSVEAERSMREIGGMRRKKRTEHVDTLAAVILLQSYLEGKRLQE